MTMRLMRGVVVAVITAVALLAGGISDGEAQNCYRAVCKSSSGPCDFTPTSEGKCCCNVSCQGGEGGVTCSCTTSVPHPCGSSCPACFPGLAVRAAGETGGFPYSAQAFERAWAQNELAAHVLQNLTRNFSQDVPLGVHLIEGKSNALGGLTYAEPTEKNATDFAYEGVVTAMSDRIVLELWFERFYGGPLPDPIRVEIDQAGNVSMAPLPIARIDTGTECSRAYLE